MNFINIIKNKFVMLLTISSVMLLLGYVFVGNIINTNTANASNTSKNNPTNISTPTSNNTVNNNINTQIDQRNKELQKNNSNTLGNSSAKNIVAIIKMNNLLNNTKNIFDDITKIPKASPSATQDNNNQNSAPSSATQDNNNSSTPETETSKQPASDPTTQAPKSSATQAPKAPATTQAPAPVDTTLWSDWTAGSLADYRHVPCGGLWQYMYANYYARELNCPGSAAYLNLGVGQKIKINNHVCTMVGSQVLDYNKNTTSDINWMGNTIVQTCLSSGGSLVKLVDFKCD